MSEPLDPSPPEPTSDFGPDLVEVFGPTQRDGGPTLVQLLTPEGERVHHPDFDLDFSAEQSYLQPPEHQTDIVHVIKGVIEAETGAIEHYNRIIEFTDGLDFVTQDMVIAILHDEQGHKRLFEGFLREYEAEGLA